MEQRLVQLVCGLLSAAVIWGFSTINDLQLAVERMMYQYANTEDIRELRDTVKRLQWILQDDAMEK
jgi:hypothetical protein